MVTTDYRLDKLAADRRSLQDRRRHCRVNIKTLSCGFKSDLQGSDAKSEVITDEALLFNIGATGVGIKTRLLLKHGMNVVIQVPFLDRPLYGQIIWSKRLAKPAIEDFSFSSGVGLTPGISNDVKTFPFDLTEITVVDGRRTIRSHFEQAERFAKRLKNVKRNSVYVYFRIYEASKNILTYSSNDFLGLARDPRVIEASQKALKKYGISTAASPILAGLTPIHEKLEAELAKFKKKEKALVCTSGYVANLGAISAITTKDSVIFIDEKAHASMFHGCRSSNATMRIFKHNDLNNLVAKISRYPVGAEKFVLIEGLYSMDGDLARIKDIEKIARMFNAALIMDDGHSIGIFMNEGCGIEEDTNSLSQCDVITGSFGKAFGASGGFVVADEDVIEYLRHFAHPFMFTTGLPPYICAGILESFKILQTEPERRQKLMANAKILREGLLKLGYDISHCESHLIPVIFGNETTTYKVTKALEKMGIYVNPLARPAVKRGGSRIRLGVRFDHTSTDLARTLEAFRKIKNSVLHE